MPRLAAVALASLSLAVAGCATTRADRGGTDVTRYHLGQPIEAGGVTIEPMANNTVIGPEFRSYGDAVAIELARLGFPSAGDAAPPQYIAAVSFVRTSRGTVRTPPKFSIGIGGGSYGGGVGLGGGVSTGIGGKTRDLLVSELAVQLRRRSDGTIVWEGRAQRGGLSGPDDQPAAVAGRLAAALFRGFPGESGITISVP